MVGAKVPITLKVRNKFDLKGELFRNIAPYTVKALMKVGRFEGWAVSHDHGFMLLTDVRAGLEKARKEFKKGEIGFLPINGSMWFFVEDVEAERPMSPIGHIFDLELLESVKRGDYLTLIIEEII